MAAAEVVADEAEKLLAGGFRAVKLRLGYPTWQEDQAAVRAVRRRIGDGVALMVDYNQALGVAEALDRGRMLDDENIFWLEEPIRHDDYAGCARLARELKTPIQIGENFSLVSSMKAALAAGAADYVMPDLERIGGVTGWQRAAMLAAEPPLRYPDWPMLTPAENVATELLDAPAVAAELEELAKLHGEHERELRNAVAQRLKAALIAGRAAAERLLLKDRLGRHCAE